MNTDLVVDAYLQPYATSLWIMANNRYDILLDYENHGLNVKQAVHPWFYKYYERYKQVLKRTRERAQKKIYFWIIPKIYDISRESGKRLAQKNYQKFLDM